MGKSDTFEVVPLISSIVGVEFRKAGWFKGGWQAKGQPLGLSEPAAQSALAAFELDVEQRVWAVASSEWEGVVIRAEKLALDHTPRHGARAMNILHLAFALQFGATELLSFDENQRRVAPAEGLGDSPSRSGRGQRVSRR